MVRALLLAAAALLIAACQSGPAPKTLAPHTAAAGAAATATAAYIEGRAFYLERSALPPGATLDVQLIADPPTDAPATIAQRSFSDLHGPPFDFALPYDPARIRADTHYVLRATLRNARGHLEFYTPTRVAVTPGSGRVVEFRLQRFAGG